MKSGCFLSLLLAICSPLNSARAVEYYYSSEEFSAIGIAYAQPPAPNFLEDFQSGRFVVTLDTDPLNLGPGATAGLLTVEGQMFSAGIDPRCSAGGTQCPDYLGNPAHLYLEKPFSLEEQFAFDEVDGAFTVDRGPVQNSFIEYLGGNGNSVRFPLASGSEPLHSDAPLRLVGAFNFIPAWPGVTTEELVIQLDLTFHGATPPAPIPEPATLLLLAGAGISALLPRKARSRPAV